MTGDARDPRSTSEKARADLMRNDAMGLGVPESPLERQPSVTPETFGDDSEAARLSPIGLTSVAQEPGLLARLAVERMIDRIERRRLDRRDIVLEPQLRVRASSRAISASMS